MRGHWPRWTYWRQSWVSASSSSLSSMTSRPGSDPKQKRSAQTYAPVSSMSLIKPLSSTYEPTTMSLARYGFGSGSRVRISSSVSRSLSTIRYFGARYVASVSTWNS